MAEWWGGGKEHISEKKSRILISKDAGYQSTDRKYKEYETGSLWS